LDRPSAAGQSSDSGSDNAGAPPWLWLWAAQFVIHLPWLFGDWIYILDHFNRFRAQTAVLQQIDPGFHQLDVLWYPSVLLDFLPSLALLIGIVSVVLPQIRARHVRNRFRLGPLPDHIPEVAEITAFIRPSAPKLEIVGNLLRAAPLAFVFVDNHRQASIAITGGLVRLWAADRKAAEAVLLHEIAHYRRGDARIIGVGTAFEYLVKFAFLAFFALYIVPTLVILGDQFVRARQEFLALGMPPHDVWRYQILSALEFAVLGLVVPLLTYVVWFGSFLIVPLAGIWSAELNADRMASQGPESGNAIARGLRQATGRPSWWRWALFRLYHPPAWLRTWLLRRSRYWSTVLLVMVFPAGCLLEAGMNHTRASFMAFVGGSAEIAPALPQSLAIARPYLVEMLLFWLPVAGAILLWPWAVQHWERFVSRGSGTDLRSGRGGYVISAGLILVMAVARFAFA
jgi:hypothetical protein